MKIRYIIPFILLLATIFNSCDKVSLPFREKIDYCSGNKKVLIEDYTGHGCVNCPEAAVELHNLNKALCEDTDRLVIIGVHAGFFAKPNFENNPLFAADFRTEAGNTWDSFFGNSAMGNPNGLVDRVKGSNGYVFYPESWGDIAAPRLLEPAKALITIGNDFNTESKELSTFIRTEFQEEIAGNYKLIVCITQNNIIAPQKNNNPDIGTVGIIIDYVHNHVLRIAINGAWGENLSISGEVVKGVTYEKTYTQSFANDWIPADCNVVAFVYNEETKTVLQVEELAVLE